MEIPERVRLLATLKCGNKVWGKGQVLDAEKDGRPIPMEILAEIRANTGKVEVLPLPYAPPPPPPIREDEDLHCPQCEHVPFATEAALKTHITKNHSEPQEVAEQTSVNKEVEDGHAGGIGDTT